MNFKILGDNKLAEKAEVFSPYNDVPDIGGIFEISSNLNIPKTSILTLTNYVDTKEPEADEDPVLDMLLEL